MCTSMACVGKVAVIEAPPELWRNTRQQLKWIWDRLSQTWIRDTEVTVVKVTPKATVEHSG
jgi:hypothetical protein